MKDSHIKAEENDNKNKAQELSRRLILPPDELLHIITSAGLAAIEHALELRGEVTFPVVFEALGRDFGPPEGTLPVHLPADMVRKLNSMGECIGINDGAVSYITGILTNDLEPREGSGVADILQSLYEISDPATMSELYRIQAGDGAEKSDFLDAIRP